jgi:hypothetical protein
MTTRLQRSALDYAIACLARGRRPESLEQLRAYVDGDAYSRAIELVAEAENLRRGDVTLASWPACLAYARRIVRAWLALYLRRVRRDEARRIYDNPANIRGGHTVRVSWARIVYRPDTWRPLWLDAPAWDPLVSPMQRRERGRVAA